MVEEERGPTGPEGPHTCRVATGHHVAGVEIVLDVAVHPGRPCGAGEGAGEGATRVAGRRVPVLLLAGLGAQRIDWPEGLLRELIGAGYDVITFDNRDAGASTVLPGPVPETEVLRALAAAPSGSTSEAPSGSTSAAPSASGPPYRLVDLAADAVAVLDHLDVHAAHVLGRSMGGMVAQHLAARWPERVRSLTVLASTSGADDVGRPTPEAADALTAPTPSDRAGILAAGVARGRLTGSPGWYDEADAHRRLAARYDRGHHPEGTARQLWAILADPDRTPMLAGVVAPTLVLHGELDPLVTPSGGAAVAAAIAGARVELIADLGHDLPVGLLHRLTEPLLAHLDAVDAPTTGSG